MRKGALHKERYRCQGGDIAYAARRTGPVEAAAVIDGRGLVASCGYRHACASARAGYSYKEDIVTGTAAAAAGGFTRVLAMPNTDQSSIVRENLSLAKSPAWARDRRGPVRRSRNRRSRKSERLTDFAALKAGAAALSDDGYR